MSSLLELSRATTQPFLNIVYVHGLGGDAKFTWTHSNGSFWPTWIAEAFPRTNVYSVSYDAAPFKWRGHAMPLQSRARDVAHLLAVNRIDDHKVVFICHSLGGLVVKQALRISKDDDGKNDRLFAATAGIVFLATPSLGSHLATNVCRFLPFIPSVATRDLVRDSESLIELDIWFRRQLADDAFRVSAYAETKRMWLNTVVRRRDSDPGVPPVPLDESHDTIARIPHPGDTRFKAVCDLIAELAGIEPREIKSAGSVRSGDVHRQRQWSRMAIAVALVCSILAGMVVTGWWRHLVSECIAAVLTLPRDSFERIIRCS